MRREPRRKRDVVHAAVSRRDNVKFIEVALALSQLAHWMHKGTACAIERSDHLRCKGGTRRAYSLANFVRKLETAGCHLHTSAYVHKYYSTRVCVCIHIVHH